MNQKSKEQDVPKDPSVIKFMTMHSAKTIGNLIGAVISFVRNIITILTAAWMIPYAGLVCNEMLFMYFEACKEKKLPFIRLPSFMMTAAIAGQKSTGSLRKTIKQRMKDQYGGLGFMLKMAVMPFHYTSIASTRMGEFDKEADKYNKNLEKEYKKEDGTLDGERMGEASMKVMEVFYDTFNSKEPENESE